MNTELHIFLSHNFTKRYTDGVEVVKPESYGVENWALNASEAIDNQAYNQATPLIKLPTLEEFWDRLCEYVVKSLMSTYDAFEMINRFRVLVGEELTLSQFVPCKDGKVLEGYYKDGNLHYDGVSTDELEKSQQEVLFEGWEVYSNKSSHIGIKRDNHDSIVFHDSGIITVLDPTKKFLSLTQLKTISDAIELGIYIKPKQ